MKTNKWQGTPKKITTLLLMSLILIFCMLTAGCQQKEQVSPKPSVPVGTWIESEKIAEKDSKPHTMKYRIDSVVRDQKIVMAAIKAYNLSAKGSLIGQMENDNLEFCLVNYSAFYPKDFPQKRFGLTDVAVPFEIVSLTGGEISVGDTIYKNLSTTWEIGERPTSNNFHAGDTYHGQIIYIMVKGYSDYLLHEIKGDKADNGDAVESYIKGE